MKDNIKDLLRLIEEHPDLPVIPMVGQDIVADCTGEWVASFGKAEVKKMCIYGEDVIFREKKNASKTVEALELDGIDWLEAIIVHIETPTVKIPDNTEKINELYGGC